MLLRCSLLGLMLLAGCVSRRTAAPETRPPFQFGSDTLCYPNELVWEYSFAPDGKRSVRRREPPASYSHHCFVVARAARQFWLHAEFRPGESALTPDEYRGRVREIVSRTSRKTSRAEERVLIPGYRDLHDFCTEYESLIKAESGGAWRSYFQRGHWRILLPFSRAHQARMAKQLETALAQGRPPIVHVIRFPQLSINHAVLLFAAARHPGGLEFSAYDPNAPEQVLVLRYEEASQKFIYPQTAYFRGGPVDLYEIYSQWNY
jgi:hypothetical protein